MTGIYRSWRLTLVALLLAHTSLTAQTTTPARPRTGIIGSVLDAQTGTPIDAAAVVLQPEVLGAFPAGPASGSAFTTSSRAVLSQPDGTYRFDALAPGVYRIYVSRIGYRPYSITIELRAGISPVAVALLAEPIPLQPVRSRTTARGPYESADAFGSNVAVARLFAADQRRLRFLTTDARELTHADVIEAVTLGEPDVLRALQRFPGVTTRSDYTAELWTRGAPWSHTRVYFDGVPLFNPLHALGVVSGIGSNAIGTVWFHPGARSANIGEGAAGVVDLQSRRASGDGAVNLHGDISLMNAALALDQRVLDGRAGWMLSARQTYIDWLATLARRASGRDDAAFPYGFSELAGRADVWLSDATALEASWLWERDRLESRADNDPESLRAEWGNVAGRVSLATRIRGLQVHHAAGVSTHDGLVRSRGDSNGIPASNDQISESETTVRYFGFKGTIAPEPASLAGPTWSVGYGVELQHVGYFGPQVLPVPRFAVAQSADALNSNNVRTSWEWTLPIAVLSTERNWSPGERLAVRAGVRAETSGDVAHSGNVRFAPRMSARFMPIPEVALSAGISRIYQYAQAIAPSGVYVASLATTDVWLLADPSMPALRADIATIGAESWLTPGRALSVNAFVRHATGVAASDPRPGRLYDRPAYVIGENRAQGIELSARQITGRVTGSASYTLSRSRMAAVGRDYAASADRPHVFNATAMVRATAAFRTGAAFTAASGVPFTRTIATAQECALDPGCDATKLPWVSEPNAARAPTFASLDLLVDYTKRVRGLELGAYVQLRNALGRENATIYTADGPGCMPAGCGNEPSSEYERGVPRLPVVGLRVRR